MAAALTVSTLRGLLVDLVPIPRDFDRTLHVFWNNESRIWATVGETAPVPRTAVQRMLDAQAEGPEPGYSEVHFAMQATNGALIGTMDLWIVQPHRWAWVAAWIGDPTYWSGGYGTDGLLLLADYSFRWLDVRRMVVVTMAINTRAQRNVERCGFILEGRRRRVYWVNGAWVDELRYGLLQDDWPGRDVLVERAGLHQRVAREQERS